MDRVNHLWPDIAALVPNKKIPHWPVAWLHASNDTSTSLPNVVVKKRPSLSAQRCAYLPGLFAHRSAMRATSEHSRVHWTFIKSVMEWAFKHGHVNVLRFLRHWGLALDAMNQSHKKRAQYLAATHGRVNVLEFVMQWRESSQKTNTPTQDDEVGNTKKLCMFWEEQVFPPALKDMCIDKMVAGAASYGHVSVLAFFKKHGLTQKHVRRDNNAPLRYAAEYGHVNVLEFLKNTWHLTPDDARSLKNYALTNAAKNGHVHVLQFLKDQWHLTPDDARAQGNEPLLVAGKFGHVNVLQFLKEQWGLTLRDVRMWQNAALSMSAVYDQVHVLEFLLNWRDPPKETADERPPWMTLNDLRTGENYVLSVAIGTGRISILRVLREWRDAEGNGLTRQDLHTVRAHLRDNAILGATIPKRSRHFLDEWDRELQSRDGRH